MRSTLALFIFIATFAIAAEGASSGAEFPLAPAEMRVPVRSGAFGVASNGDNVLAAFEDYREVGSSRVYLARIASDGRLLDSTPLALPLRSDPRIFRRFLLVWDGLEYLLSWSEAGGQYYLVRIAADGRVLDATPHSVTFESDFPAVVWTGSKLLSMYPSGDGLIHARGIDPSGAQSEFISARPADLSNWSSLLAAAWTSRDGVSFWDTQSPDGISHSLSSLRFDSTWRPTSIATSFGPMAGHSVIAAPKGDSTFVMWRDAAWACKLAVLGAQNNFISACPALDLTFAISAIGIPGGYAAVTSDPSLPFRVTRFSDRGEVLDSKTIDDGLLADSPPLLTFNGSSVTAVWESPTTVRAPSGVGTGPLFAQLLSSNLDAISPASSIALATAAPPELSADAACNGSRCGIALTEERVAGHPSLIVGRMTADGGLIDGQGIELSALQSAQGRPRVVFDGHDFVIVHNAQGLSATRIGADEATPSIKTLSERAIAVDSGGGQFAAAADRAGNTAVAFVKGTAICASVLTSTSRTWPLCFANDTPVSDPAIAFDGEEFVITWHRLAFLFDPRVPLQDLIGVRLRPDGTSPDSASHKIVIPTTIRTDLQLFAVQGKLVATWLEDYGKNLAGAVITPAMEVERGPFRIAIDNQPYAAAADAHGLTVVSLGTNGSLQGSDYTYGGQAIRAPQLVGSQISAAHSLRLVPFGDGRKLALYGHPDESAAGSLRSFARFIGEIEQTRRRTAR